MVTAPRLTGWIRLLTGDDLEFVVPVAIDVLPRPSMSASSASWA